MRQGFSEEPSVEPQVQTIEDGDNATRPSGSHPHLQPSQYTQNNTM